MRSTAAAAKSLQSFLTLCDPIDSSPPDSLVPGIPQARTLEWVVISFSNTRDTAAAAAKSLQSFLTPSDPMDCSLPGSSVHGIFQARVLEWGAIAFSELILRCLHCVNNLRVHRSMSFLFGCKACTEIIAAYWSVRC